MKVLSVVSGVALGIGISLGVSALRTSEKPTPSGSITTIETRTETDPALQRQLAQLQQRLTQLEGRQAQKTTPPTSQERVVLRQEEEQHYADKLRSSDNEPLDQAWAAQVVPSFSKDLADLKGVEVERVACRSKTCTADLKWPSYAAATAGFNQLLHRVYSVNCAREIVLPEPANMSEPYSARALFDCSEARGLN